MHFIVQGIKDHQRKISTLAKTLNYAGISKMGINSRRKCIFHINKWSTLEKVQDLNIKNKNFHGLLEGIPFMLSLF